MISYDEFKKVEIRAGKILSAEKIPDTTGVICSPPRDAREVERAVNDLQSEIDRYDNVASRLRGRLECITAPASPECCGVGSVDYSTILASTLGSAFVRLRNITNDLELLYERIEL